jgi:hypothetical protein
MKAVEILRKEEDALLQLVDDLVKAVAQVPEGGRMYAENFRALLGELNERVKFERLAKLSYLALRVLMREAPAGLAEGEAWGKELHFLKTIERVLPEAANGNAFAQRTLEEHVRAYAELVCSQTEAQSRILYDNAERSLNEDDDAAALAYFSKVNQKVWAHEPSGIF